MKQKIIAIMLILSLFLVGCQQPFDPADDSKATEESVKAVIEANNQFAFELYSELNDPDKNLFFSPYSISTALAMTYEGAKGQTAEEMQQVFHFSIDPDERRPAFARIYNDINKGDKDYKLNTANALWAQQDYLFIPEYFNIIDQYYGGKVTNLDFKAETEKSRVIINDWVEEKTNDKIKDIIPLGVLSPMTRLVISNAIYFKGDWVYEFKKSSTKDKDFFITPENKIKVPMMYLDNSKARFNYAENDDLQVIELPYKGEELSMMILLPKENDISIAEDYLSNEKIDELESQMTKRNMEVYLPKFKFETKYMMSVTLKNMGMPSAFSDDADFSGMTGNKDLSISEVIHQAFVEVNEEGTEAAAATVVVIGETMSVGPGPMNIFNANHPFIFMIKQNDTGNILFVGKVSDSIA